MMIGHAALAFALVASVCAGSGWPRDRALVAGLVAGAFATAPDVDMAYALFGLVEAGFSSLFGAADAFWAASSLVHRTVTHSIVVAVPAGVAAGALAFAVGQADPATDPADPAAPATERVELTVRGGIAVWRWLAAGLGVALLGGLVAVATAASGVLGGIIMGLFAITVAGLAIVAGRLLTPLVPNVAGLRARTVLGAALVGLASHPFGDVFTGEPPGFLYPIDATLVAERIALHPDPTLHLLGAFGVELAAVWLGAITYLRVSGRGFREALKLRCGIGVAYAGAALVLPPPTLSLSYHFVFSILAIGLLVAAPEAAVAVRTVGRQFHGSLPRGRTVEATDGGISTDEVTVARARLQFRENVLVGVLTGLSAVTVAWLAYTLIYVAAVA